MLKLRAECLDLDVTIPISGIVVVLRICAEELSRIIACSPLRWIPHAVGQVRPGASNTWSDRLSSRGSGTLRPERVRRQRDSAMEPWLAILLGLIAVTGIVIFLLSRRVPDRDAPKKSARKQEPD